ncbi:MAG: chemotaxis protein CheW [Pirellulales bacterium]
MIDHRHDEPLRVEQPMPECWRIVGVAGDRSCPELQSFIHCRNCPVLAEAARSFFDREAPAGYLESWRAILEEPAESTETADTGVLVFRIDGEWLALPTAVLVEVTVERRLHSVPHRAGGALAGLVNIRGQLQPCVSLHAILGLDGSPSPGPGGLVDGDASHVEATTRRLMVVERTTDRGTDRWVLGIDELAGVHRVGSADLRPVPSTVSQAAARCCSALFAWQDRTVALLDEGRLFDALRDAVSP